VPNDAVTYLPVSSWRDAIPIIVVGTSCIAIPMVLNGAIGAKLHIPFSVAIRASFGYYLAYFCIVSRCILAMFWYVLLFLYKQYMVVMSRVLKPKNILSEGSARETLPTIRIQFPVLT
jgi:purine-cytosine permease-like protein